MKGKFIRKKAIIIGITLLFFGVVLIPNITAETIKDIENNKISIDSNIYLTKNDLFSINQALKKIQNNNFINILTEIKEKILEKGFVDSNDIELICEDLHIQQGGIHVGYFSGFGYVSNQVSSQVFSFPGYFLFNRFIPYFGPVVYVSWDLNDYYSYKAWYVVNVQEKVYGHHSGVAIAGFSLISKVDNKPSNLYDYNIRGFFSLILID